MNVTLELALIRFAVVAKRWDGLAGGLFPELNAFLAGWCMRVIDAPKPDNVGSLRDSFRAGWEEADVALAIQRRQDGVSGS